MTFKLKMVTSTMILIRHQEQREPLPFTRVCLVTSCMVRDLGAVWMVVMEWMVCGLIQYQAV